MDDASTVPRYVYVQDVALKHRNYHGAMVVPPGFIRAYPVRSCSPGAEWWRATFERFPGWLLVLFRPRT